MADKSKNGAKCQAEKESNNHLFGGDPEDGYQFPYFLREGPEKRHIKVFR
jgi:hypothetical protein